MSYAWFLRDMVSPDLSFRYKTKATCMLKILLWVDYVTSLYIKKYDCHAKMEICVFVTKIKDFHVCYHKLDLVTQISLYCTAAVLDWKQQMYHLEKWMASSLPFFVYPGLTPQTTPSLHCLPTPLVTMPSHVIGPGRHTLHHLWSMNTTALMSTTRE